MTYVFEFPFSPDWASLALIPLGAILLAVLAAFVAAIPALNARPARGTAIAYEPVNPCNPSRISVVQSPPKGTSYGFCPDAERPADEA